MTQYEVAKTIFMTDSVSTVKSISRHLGLRKGTVRYSLTQLSKKGIIEKHGTSVTIAAEIDECDIESIKGVNLEDLI